MWRRAATEVVSKHAGQFPDTAAELRDLPGIGPYAAAAIASICFGERIAVVDGNVERVLSRITGRNLVRAEVWQLAQEFLSPTRPGEDRKSTRLNSSHRCISYAVFCLKKKKKKKRTEKD